MFTLKYELSRRHRLFGAKLDRFGRVDNCLWRKGSTTLAQVQYGYDRAANRTWRKDGVLTGYDELYLYDGLNRLKDQIRGTLNGTQTAITSSTFQQQWGLDATGNWQAFKQDTDGNGTWDLVQSRTANKANEITAINNTTGTAWVTPGYDKAGNMIGIPSPTISSTATYDAWNRLIGVTDASTSITNDYDARGFRITETTGGVVRRYYYTPGWQCAEERTGTLTTPERQFVWGMRYIDDLVIRDRSTANNGSINERRYAMQDGNWNTVAICDITGTVGERYAYSAYGTPVFMTGAGAVQSSSPIGFETLYAGYRWDNATPQMYYVRNRFLLPQVGTWNKRDPLGYVDGMGLFEYNMSGPMSFVDPSGTQGFVRPGVQRSTTFPGIHGPGFGGRGTQTGGGPRVYGPGHLTRPSGFEPLPGTEHYRNRNLYQTPNGPSLIPYWWEEQPWYVPGRKRDPRYPSKYDPSTWPGGSGAPFPGCSMSAPSPRRRIDLGIDPDPQNIVPWSIRRHPQVVEQTGTGLGPDDDSWRCRQRCHEDFESSMRYCHKLTGRDWAKCRDDAEYERGLCIRGCGPMPKGPPPDWY